MSHLTHKGTVMEELYSSYLDKGFITEEETLDCFVTYSIPLTQMDYVIDHLLSAGVIIRYESDCEIAETDDISDDEDNQDRSRSDYDAIFSEVLQISPNQKILIDYLRKIRPPQNREWKNIIQKAQNGNGYAYNRIFEMYMRVVIKISLKYYKEFKYELDDIIQVGSMGLLQAIKAFDLSKHGNFSSYMPLWIGQYINRAICDLSRTIRLPVHMWESMNNVAKITSELDKKSEMELCNEEIAKKCNIALEKYEQIVKSYEDILSIEDFLNIDEDGYCYYHIIDDERFQVENIVEQKLLTEILLDLLDSLKEKERNILKARYGLNGASPKTLEEVGLTFGVTRERIRQIEMKAITKLQHPTRAKMLLGY